LTRKIHTSISESVKVLDSTDFGISGCEADEILLEILRFIVSVWSFGRFVCGGDIDFRVSVIKGRVNRGFGAGRIGIRWSSFARGIFCTSKVK